MTNVPLAWASSIATAALGAGLVLWGKVPIRFGWLTRRDTPALFWGLIAMLAGFAAYFALVALGVVSLQST